MLVVPFSSRQRPEGTSLSFRLRSGRPGACSSPGSVSWDRVSAYQVAGQMASRYVFLTPEGSVANCLYANGPYARRREMLKCKVCYSE